VVDANRVRRCLGTAVRAPWIKRCAFGLRHFADQPVHFARGGLIKPGLDADLTDCFQQPDGASCGDVGGVFRTIEADSHMALRCEIVNLLRLYFADQSRERAGIAEIAVMQKEPALSLMWIGIDIIEAAGIEGAG